MGRFLIFSIPAVTFNFQLLYDPSESTVQVVRQDMGSEMSGNERSNYGWVNDVWIGINTRR
jgi:hypothetical protein